MARNVNAMVWEKVSLASSQTSKEVDLQSMHLIGITIDCKSVSANTGSFKIEVSNGGDWQDLGVTIAALANADKNYLINLNQIPYAKMRLGFTPGGGGPNGTVTAYVCGKSMGG